MADRSRQGDAERARDAAQLAAFARGRAEAEAKEAAKAQKRADGLRNQAQYNRQQLEDNLAAREREKQEAYLEWRLQKKFEASYEQRVQQLIASADPGEAGAGPGLLLIRRGGSALLPGSAAHDRELARGGLALAAGGCGGGGFAAWSCGGGHAARKDVHDD